MQGQITKNHTKLPSPLLGAPEPAPCYTLLRPFLLAALCTAVPPTCCNRLRPACCTLHSAVPLPTLLRLLHSAPQSRASTLLLAIALSLPHLPKKQRILDKIGIISD
ncbi:hypothetical protein SLEP1_g50452 [Rubroshorea leprosula]|uniref:Uncharacterized protein n=1 Tax=Rubroshorea leprosula TaxID=152421 RepID=A0AAV5M238_9ROSI|nr:hypothetical protein SLEP1_g50452 [Rubroshorea leprosula]